MFNEKENFPISNYYEEQFKKDSSAVLHEVHSEEQESSYSCGPAVLTDVLKTLGKSIDQLEIMNEVRKEIRAIRPPESKQSLSDLGTPPEVLQKILSNHGVNFEIKESDQEINQENSILSEQYLDQKLNEGYIVITAVQTIPTLRPLKEEESYKDLRNISEDGHYLIVCGVVTIDGKKSYITVDPMFHYYQRASNEGWVYGMHKGDNVDENTPKTAPETEYESVETRTIPYTEEELKKFDIDPSMYGLRLISAGNFMRNWKDVSGFGKPFNHYGIAVKVK